MKVAGLCLSLACGLLLPAHASAEYRISGPYTHENLSIFLIHGNGGGRNYLTLKDAVAQKKVVVSETKKVNELAVENVSAGYHTLAEAFSGWRDSPPHKANMLKNGVTKLGIAATYAPNTKYKVFWTLILAST